jgi:hypothetical protein
MSNVDVTREAKAIYWLQAFFQYNNLIHLSVVCLCMNFILFLIFFWEKLIHLTLHKDMDMGWKRKKIDPRKESTLPRSNQPTKLLSPFTLY